MTPHTPPAVTVRRMTDAEFENWRGASIASFASDLATATGRDRVDTLARAEQQFAELLPAGPNTESTWLMRVLDNEGTDVGYLWVGPHPQRSGHAFVYDIEISDDHRGRGLGRAAMVAAEQLVLEAGITEIGLNVFGFNDSARRLYDSLGYRVVATQMTKTLTSTTDSGMLG